MSQDKSDELSKDIASEWRTLYTQKLIIRYAAPPAWPGAGCNEIPPSKCFDADHG
jgi:hypothetical protein